MQQANSLSQLSLKGIEKGRERERIKYKYDDEVQVQEDDEVELVRQTALHSLITQTDSNDLTTMSLPVCLHR